LLLDSIDPTRIRTANILLVSIKALANEIAKNLVLAGIGSLTLADHEVVTEQDLGAQFFISDADVGKNVRHFNTSQISILTLQRAEAAAPQVRKLNPRVKVNVITTDVRSNTDTDFLAAYDIVIATDLDFMSLSNLNAATRVAHKRFYAGASHGMYGYIFADLIDHSFVIEREKSNRNTLPGPETITRRVAGVQTKRENGKAIEMVTKQEIYTPMMLIKDVPLPPEIATNRRRLKKVHPLLTCVRALWEFQMNPKIQGIDPTDSDKSLAIFTTLAKEAHELLFLPAETLTADFLRSFLQNLNSELAPVTAFLGGQLAQDVINVLGQREQPIQNLMMFDGEDSAGPVYAMHPVFQKPKKPDTTLPILPGVPVIAPIMID
jgi:ubiquitin-like 1-activating enzyme E1 A